MGQDLIEKFNPIIAESGSKDYSIHTLTFRARLTKKNMVSIKEKLIRFSEKRKDGYFKKISRNDATYKTINFNTASYFGFNMISLLTITCKNLDKYYWMDIKVNPRWMFHKDNHPFVYIADKKDLVLCYERINQFLKKTKIEEIDHNAFYIQRADYCVNIGLEDREHVKEYMRLMKKGAYPYKSKRKMEYSKTGKREVPTKDSFTVYTNGFEFSVYDKQIQLSRETEKYSEDEIQEAEGTIRIELRVKRSKIRYDEKKGGCKSALEFLLSVDEIAGGNIPRYLEKAYGSGKFVKFKRARKIIDASNYKNKTKNEMVEILHRVSRAGLQEVKIAYGEKFFKYMKRFNDLDISPITIGKGSSFSELESPLYYIEHKNKNYY